jgi:hypothetical protein
MGQARMETRTEHSWARKLYKTPASLPAALPEGIPLGMTHDGMMFGCFFRRIPGESAPLVVSLSGSTGPSMRRPVFFRRNWHQRLGANVLCISDPSLLLDPSIRTGAFLGRLKQDPIDGIIVIAREVADRIKVPLDRVIFWGASSGGFAAMMCALRCEGRAIAVNPQLDLTASLGAADAQKLLELYKPGITNEQFMYDHNRRTKVASVVESGEGDGTRLAILQNVRDRHHYLNHFVPFCERLGLEHDGESAGILTMTYEHEDGHMAETNEMVADLLRRAVPFLLGTRVVRS